VPGDHVFQVNASPRILNWYACEKFVCVHGMQQIQRYVSAVQVKARALALAPLRLPERENSTFGGESADVDSWANLKVLES